MLGCPLMVQRHALVLLLCSACWLRPCSVQHLKQQCSNDDLFQLLAHAFQWKKSEQVGDSLIRCQLVERKAFHRSLLLFVSKGWNFHSKQDHFNIYLLRGDLTLSLTGLVQTTDLNQNSPYPPANSLMVGSQDASVSHEKLEVPLKASGKISSLSVSRQVMGK